MQHEITADGRELMRRALGLLWRRTPYRNRVACHLNGPTIEAARALVADGLMIGSTSDHYGKMRVFRVTLKGAEALGIKLKPALRPIMPEDVDAAIRLAA